VRLQNHIFKSWLSYHHRICAECHYRIGLTSSLDHVSVARTQVRLESKPAIFRKLRDVLRGSIGTILSGAELFNPRMLTE
jgi:hypothetical protein